MYPDRRHHLVEFGINDTNVARAGVHYVNFVLLAIGCDSRGFTPYLNGFQRLKGTQINYADRVALAIGNVSVLAVGRAIIREATRTEIQPEANPNYGKQDCGE